MPLTASVEEFLKLAERYRENRDWPLALDILEANWIRLPEGSPAGPEAEKAWNTAKQEYETVLFQVL